MQRMISMQRWTLLMLAVTGLVVLSGCGGSAYEALMNRRLEQLRGSAPFRVLWASSPVGDTPVKIRVPMAYKASYTPLSGHPDDGGRIKPDRAQPPFLQLPGLQLTYEEFASAPDGSRLPFYCYLAVIPNGNVETQKTELQKELKAKFPNAPDEWTHVDAKTPLAKAVPWSMIRVEGEQQFYPKDAKEPVAMPGIFELWIHDAGEYVVLVGWRTPTSIESSGAAAAGGASGNPLEQLATQTKPDLKTMPALSAGTIIVDKPQEAPPAG